MFTQAAMSHRLPGSVQLLATWVTLFLCIVLPAHAGQVLLAWNANTESNLGGYRIYYGLASGSYSAKVDVGNQTNYTLTGLTDGETYFIAATAYDATKTAESGFSNEVYTALPSNTAPVVGLTAPVTGAKYAAPAAINLAATASDADGTIAQVDFYNGATLLGTDATSPYAFAWNNVSAGSYALTAVAKDNDGATTSSAVVTVMVTVPGGAAGSLSGAGNSDPAAANLTGEGNLDWVHWGDASVNRKAGVTARIGGETVIGGATPIAYGDDRRPLSWTDGTPTATGANNRNGLYVFGVGSGFSFTVPADTTTRTLTVHVGGWNSGGTLSAQLSDGSATTAPDVTAAVTGQYTRNYTFTYKAGSAGQTLTVSWTMNSGSGNVTLSGAALSGGSAAGGTGLLSATGDSSATAANLTSEGNLDWVHWGDASVNRKAGVAARISDKTVIGSGTASSYGDDRRPLSWTDGTPIATEITNRNGFYISGMGGGFSFTVPADTATRTLMVHVGGWNSGGTLSARLSDGSAAVYTDVTPAATGQYTRNYTFSYQAGSAGQTLTVSWTMSSDPGTGNGNVTLSGAALGGVSVPVIPPPTANFTASATTGVAPLTVTFNCHSTGSIGSRLWDLGDGSNATTATVSKNYANAGTYVVTLTAIGTGGSSSATKTLTVLAPTIADFSASATAGTAPMTVNFTDASSDGVTGWNWTFGDGTANSTAQNPSHSFKSPGTYTVSLTASGPNGPDTKTKTGYITVAAASTGGGTVVGTGGLVAAYGFDEVSGSTVVDSSGNANTGTLTEAVLNAPGRFGRALQFDGINDVITINDSASLDLSSTMTLEAWVYPTDWMSSWRTVMFKQNGTTGLAYALYANSDWNQPNVRIGSAQEVADFQQLTPNRWTHVVGTYDGQYLRLFLDGVLVAMQPQTGPIPVTGGKLTIGGNAVRGEYFKGYLDEVRIYNRALSQAEIVTDSKKAVTAMMWSAKADRSNPAPLQGATVKGNIYVFTTPDDTNLSQVRFWLDNATPAVPTGSPKITESVKPYDFAGTTSTGTAYPYNTVGLTVGKHTISVRATLADGSVQPAVVGNFTVTR